MTLNNLIEGLKIFKKYYEKEGDNYCISAEHDVFYVYKTDKPITEEDFNKLIDLGWIQEDVDGEEDGEANRKYSKYDQYESWASYV